LPASFVAIRIGTRIAAPTSRRTTPCAGSGLVLFAVGVAIGVYADVGRHVHEIRATLNELAARSTDQRSS
jgi:hypothetical protein